MAFLEEKNEELNEVEVLDETAENQEAEEEIVVEENGETKRISKYSKSTKKQSKVKAAFSELKKVTYPSFGSVVKRTAVVLAVTAIFLVVVIGIDQLLYLLYDLLTKNM